MSALISSLYLCVCLSVCLQVFWVPSVLGDNAVTGPSDLKKNRRHHEHQQTNSKESASYEERIGWYAQTAEADDTNAAKPQSEGGINRFFGWFWTRAKKIKDFVMGSKPPADASTPASRALVPSGFSVAFADAPKHRYTPIYEPNPPEPFVSVNAGDNKLYVGGSGNNEEFKKMLSDSGQNVNAYENLHDTILRQTWQRNAKKQNDQEIESIIFKDPNEDLEFILCRPCKKLQDRGPTGTNGAVLYSIFRDDVVPYRKKNNKGAVYVVGPPAVHFTIKQDFLDAVEATFLNVMTALCDGNEAASYEGFRHIKVCQVPLVSGGVYRHPDASEQEVAQRIIRGLIRGYRPGLAPKLVFAYDKDVFKKVWEERFSHGEEVAPNAGSQENDPKLKKPGVAKKIFAEGG